MFILDVIAKLAKIDIQNHERQRLSESITRVMGLVDQLSEVDTTNVTLMSFIRDNNYLRDDNIVHVDNILVNSDSIKDNMFTVPKVLT